jgi:hypothetical protein
MSDSKIPNRLAAIDRSVAVGDIPTPKRAGDLTDGYAAWLSRVKNSNRHAAITKNLYSWNNYKTWADKARSDWDGKK